MQIYINTFLLLLAIIISLATAQTGGALSECANGGCSLGEYCVGKFSINSIIEDQLVALKALVLSK